LIGKGKNKISMSDVNLEQASFYAAEDADIALQLTEIFQEKLINGMLERGHGHEFAERIFEQIKGFGDYGFPESHAASFALLVYFSSWLKCHEPAAFYCGLLNSQPMGFYSPSQLVQDARRHHIEIRPVDIFTSEWESILETNADIYYSNSSEQPAIRLGFQRIKGLKKSTALKIIAIRNISAITNLQSLARLARLDQGDLDRLTEGGAFRTLSGHRYQTHWDNKAITTLSSASQDFSALDHVAEKESVYLPPPAETDDLRADYRSLGLTLGRHPMAILRESKPFSQFKSADELTLLNHGRFVQVAGIVTGRQRPSSASGVIFLTLEDETNNINVVIWTRVLETFRAAVVQGRLLKIKGIMERKGSVIHVIAGDVEDMSHYLEQFALNSRDFH